MSEASSDDADEPMEQSKEDLSKSSGNLSVTTADSDKTSTPPKNLSDMPIHVAELIIKRSDYKRQLKLRKVSKTLRALVDRQIPACKKIVVDCSDFWVSINFDHHTVKYIYNVYNEYDDDDYGYEDDVYEDDYEDVGEVEEDYEEVVEEEEYEDEHEDVYEDEYEEEEEEKEEDDDFKKLAFANLASTLKNPRLQLDEFAVVYSAYGANDKEEYNTKMRNVWKSLENQVSVKEIKIHVLNPSWLLSILPYLKPGVLEKITLNFDHREVDWRTDPTGMDEIASLDQWKQAETLEFLDSFDRFPMEYATHFKRFKFCEHRMDRNKFIRISDYLSKLQNFEQCTLSCFQFLYVPGLIHQVLGEPVSSNATEEVFHHLITDSDYYLECTKPMRGCDVEIVKKKREVN